MPKKNQTQLAVALSLGTQLGFLIAVPIAGALLAGYLADNYFKTSPLFLIIGLVGGIAFTVTEVYDLLAPFIKKNGEVDVAMLDKDPDKNSYDKH